MNDLTKQWLAFAQDDLRVADLILTEGIYTQVCFHSQQCVEKAFKSVFVHTGRTVVRTHSIVTLFQQLPADLTIQIQDVLVSLMICISRFAIQTQFQGILQVTSLEKVMLWKQLHWHVLFFKLYNNTSQNSRFYDHLLCF